MRYRTLPVVAVLGGILTACASGGGGPAKTSPGPGGITMQDDKDVDRVWTAPDFNFTGYDTLDVAETRAEVPKLNPDGRENLEWARGVLRDEISKAIRSTNLFTAVVLQESEIKAGSRVLRLETTVIDYEKGGGGARFFAGIYGAGQPVIRVQGRMRDETREVFLFEDRESGHAGSARMFGGYRSDKAIQEEDMRAMAEGLARFMTRVSQGQGPK